MHHGESHEPPFDFASGPNHLTYGQGLLLRRIEAEKPQNAGVGAVIDRDKQLAPRAQLDFHRDHRSFNLNGIAFAGIAQLDDAGFVFVAQGNVQGQINVARQTHLAHGFLRRRQWLGRRR